MAFMACEGMRKGGRGAADSLEPELKATPSGRKAVTALL